MGVWPPLVDQLCAQGELCPSALRRQQAHRTRAAHLCPARPFLETFTYSSPANSDGAMGKGDGAVGIGEGSSPLREEKERQTWMNPSATGGHLAAYELGRGGGGGAREGEQARPAAAVAHCRRRSSSCPLLPERKRDNARMTPECCAPQLSQPSHRRPA